MFTLNVCTMPALFIYLLKANIALTLFYLAYRFGLRRLTFYTLNRFFLLTGILFSAVYPLVDVNAFFQGHEQLAGHMIYYVPDWSAFREHLPVQQAFSVWSLLQYVFWTGVVVMAIRFLLQLLSLLRLHLLATDGILCKETVKLVPRPISPFSFFRNIYINPSLHRPEELPAILSHEKIHVKGLHTLDVLAAELSHIFYWFNPGAWLMKTAVCENLEFIADRHMLQSGVDARSYQYSLLKASSYAHAVPLVNHFNFTHLKQRIMMMNKKHSSRMNLVKYFLLLPLLVIIMLAFNISKAGRVLPENQMEKGTTKTGSSSSHQYSYQKDTIPHKSQTTLQVKGNTAPLYVVDNVVQKDTLALHTIKPERISSINVLKGPAAVAKYGPKGANGVVEIHTKKGSVAPPPPPPPPASPKAPGKEQPTPPPPTSLSSSLRIKSEAPPLYIVDDVVQKDTFNLHTIDPNSISSVNVLKGAGAEAKYGSKGANGVIEIHTKKGSAPPPPPANTSHPKYVPPKVVKDVVFVEKDTALHYTPPKVVKDSAPFRYSPPRVVKDTNPRYVPPKVVKDSVVFRYSPPKVVKDSVPRYSPPRIVKDSDTVSFHYTPPRVIKDN